LFWCGYSRHFVTPSLLLSIKSKKFDQNTKPMILMLLLGVFPPCYLYDEDLGLEKCKDFYCLFFFWVLGGGGWGSVGGRGKVGEG
jgi:hypothetical protein